MPLGVSFIVYTILSFTPGDPVQMMLGDNYSEESYAAMQEELGLMIPSWSSTAGLSSTRSTVTSVPHTAPATRWRRRSPPGAQYHPAVGLRHAFCHSDRNSPGVISATHQYSAVDNISMVGALFGVSMPNFWLGLMLIVIFAAGLGWFPSSNFETWGALVRRPSPSAPTPWR